MEQFLKLAHYVVGITVGLLIGIHYFFELRARYRAYRQSPLEPVPPPGTIEPTPETILGHPLIPLLGLAGGVLLGLTGGFGGSPGLAGFLAGLVLVAMTAGWFIVMQSAATREVRNVINGWYIWIPTAFLVSTCTGEFHAQIQANGLVIPFTFVGWFCVISSFMGTLAYVAYQSRPKPANNHVNRNAGAARVSN